MRYMILWFSALAVTLTFTLATEKCDNGKCNNATKQETKCDTGKCDNGKKVPAKCDSGKKSTPKEAPKKSSSKCGQGKCG
ncbi:MAG: hypothetical protein ABXS91_09210 [Sulfurimonas sp.]